MLSMSERDAIADRFGVAIAQVRRDHLISHLLAALSTHVPDKVIFFGGTARDLFDLWLLARVGAITAAAAALAVVSS